MKLASRSRRKPYLTGQGNGTKGPKRKANRAVRTAKEVPKSGGAYKKESCSWDINDYSFYSPKTPKAHRK